MQTDERESGRRAIEPIAEASPRVVDLEATESIRPRLLVSIAAGAMLAGFLVVWLLSPAPARTSASEVPGLAPPPPESAPTAAAGVSNAPPTATAPAPSVTQNDTPPATEPGASPVPPGPPATTDDEPVGAMPGSLATGIRVGRPVYDRCYDPGSKVALSRAACDRVLAFEQRLFQKLRVVERCRNAAVGLEINGRLNLGVDIDFTTQVLHIFNGRSSTIPDVTRMTNCVRSGVLGMPIGGIPHRRGRYKIFIPIDMGTGHRPAAASPAASAP